MTNLKYVFLLKTEMTGLKKNAFNYMTWRVRRICYYCTLNHYKKCWNGTIFNPRTIFPFYKVSFSWSCLIVSFYISTMSNDFNSSNHPPFSASSIPTNCNPLPLSQSYVWRDNQYKGWVLMNFQFKYYSPVMFTMKYTIPLPTGLIAVQA